MKHFLTRLTALLLLLAILSGSVCAAWDFAQASVDAGYTHTLALYDGVTLTSGLQKQDTQALHENYVTLQPHSGVRPMVVFGSTLYGRSAMNDAVKFLEHEDLTMVAGVNASFFDLDTGIPHGVEITDGILRTLGGTRSTIGFYSDGSAVIGEADYEIRLTMNGRTGNILYNKALTRGSGLVLYSRDYDLKTKNTLKAYNLLLAPTDAERSAELLPQDTLELEVTEIVEDVASCDIPKNGFVLSLANATDYESALKQLQALRVGDTVLVETSCSRAWKDVTYACGAGELLVSGGKVQTDFTLDTADKPRARSAAGVRQDGTLLLYTADEASGSSGLTLPELAERLQALGCVDAINLDGGGSSTLGVQYPGYTGGSTVNTPSDGELRPCANFIFLARETTRARSAAQLFVYPYRAFALPGAEVSMTARAADRDYNAAELPGDVFWDGDGVTALKNGNLRIDADLSEKQTSVTVRGQSGDLTGEARIQILHEIDKLSLQDADGKAVASLHIPAGSTVKLTAAASYGGMRVLAENESFSWSASESVGSFEKPGVFTAVRSAEKEVSGVLTVRYGDVRKEIKVTVGTAEPFADVKNHWAASYITALYYDGTLQGSHGKDGKLYYRPNDTMTRQEFVSALMRYLGTDLKAYEDTPLPFEDVKKIADWAQSAVQAAYALGYMGGVKKNGRLYANPTATISRQEAMTILARAAKLSGGDPDNLLAFSDRKAIAAWAEEPLAAMLENKLISGSNGRLDPTGSVTRAQVAKMLYGMRSLS